MNFCFLWAILEKSACPTHTLRRLWSFWSANNFFQILLVGVALAKAPILTMVLVKQTEFALVRPPHLREYLWSNLDESSGIVAINERNKSNFWFVASFPCRDRTLLAIHSNFDMFLCLDHFRLLVLVCWSEDYF